jgi:hypothetical protein
MNQPLTTGQLAQQLLRFEHGTPCVVQLWITVLTRVALIVVILIIYSVPGDQNCRSLTFYSGSSLSLQARWLLPNRTGQASNLCSGYPTPRPLARFCFALSFSPKRQHYRPAGRENRCWRTGPLRPDAYGHNLQSRLSFCFSPVSSDFPPHKNKLKQQQHGPLRLPGRPGRRAPLR